jgi:hypothetical protein
MRKQNLIAGIFVIIGTISFTNCGLFQSKSSYVSDEPMTDTAVLDSTEAVEGYEPATYYAPADKIWELSNTELSIKLDWKNRRVLGNAKLTLKPYFYDQDSLVLDAMAMDILDIQSINTTNGSKLKNNFSYSDSEHLVVYFPKTIKSDEKVTLEINYVANPESNYILNNENAGKAINAEKGAYFINHDLSNPYLPRQFWTQGETRGSRCWFPTLDQPNQKHTHKITVRYPDTMVSVSNGYKLSHTLDAANHEFVDVWSMTQPHSVYLTMLAIGNWAEVSDKYKDKMVHYYVEPRFKNDAMQIFGNTPKMIEFFSNYTGVEYPWNKYDQVVVRNFVSGAMENTTAVIHTEGLQDKDNDMEDYISHELFHHWFGDYVTADNWGEITMNESFAKYAEYLWIEHQYGYDKAQMWLYENNEGWLKNPKDNALVNYYYNKPDDQFDNIRYNKGAAILHLLRNYIGDAAFKLAIKDYLTTYAYKNATAAEWKRSVEKVTGKNMNDFFTQWYYEKGIAVGYWTLEKISFDSTQPSSKYGIFLNMNASDNEITECKPFKLDIEYGYIGKEKRTLSTMVNTQNKFIDLNLDAAPDYVILDPKNTLVGAIKSNLEMINIPTTEATSQILLEDKDIKDQIQIHYNNMFQNVSNYKKTNLLIDFIVELNAAGRLDLLDSNQYLKIIDMGMNSNESLLQDYTYALIRLLKEKAIYNFADKEYSLLSQYCNAILIDSKTSNQSKLKALETLFYLDNNKDALPEKQLIELSKSENFQIFENTVDCIGVLYGVSAEDEETPLNKDGEAYWITYAEGQLKSNIPSKRKVIWINAMFRNYMRGKNIAKATKLYSQIDQYKMHVEDLYAVYSNLAQGALDDENYDQNATSILLSECDNAVITKNIHKIKSLKELTTNLWKSNMDKENSTIESERSLYITLKKLHNFEIK